QRRPWLSTRRRSAAKCWRCPSPRALATPTPTRSSRRSSGSPCGCGRPKTRRTGPWTFRVHGPVVVESFPQSDRRRAPRPRWGYSRGRVGRDGDVSGCGVVCSGGGTAARRVGRVGTVLGVGGCVGSGLVRFRLSGSRFRAQVAARGGPPGGELGDRRSGNALVFVLLLGWQCERRIPFGWFAEGDHGRLVDVRISVVRRIRRGVVVVGAAGRGAVVTGRIGFGGVSAAAVCGLGLLVAVCSLGIRFRGGGVDRRGVLGLAVVRFRVPLGVDCQLLRSRVRGFLAGGCGTIAVVLG